MTGSTHSPHDGHTDPGTTALVVVDMQHDFASPKGSLFVQGGDTILDAVNAAIASARDDGSFIVYTQDWHPASTPHFIPDGGVWPVHCVRDTWGAQLCDGLTIEGPVVRKGTGGEDGYSGFSMRDPESGAEMQTELDDLLRRRSITHVTVIGLAFDVCVKATALDAVANGYATTVLLDLTRPVQLQPGDSERAAIELTNAGVTVR